LAISIHAPTTTPAPGSTHDGSAMLPRRQSPGHRVRTQLFAARFLARHANA